MKINNSSNMFPKLEVNINSFKDRIIQNCLYVDKTQYIYDLINSESHCFLARPPKFGKSLLVSTLKEMFSGNKELFKNCWIYDKINWEPYPIIHLDFIEIDFKTFGLEQAVDQKLESIVDQFNIKLRGISIKEKFGEMIKVLSNNQKVVILIDNYDKPFMEYIDNTPKAEKNWDILKNFLSILEARSSHIQFLLITGVSKYGNLSIFGDLNYWSDITSHPRYSQMLGFTSDEIEDFFSPYITEWENQTGEKRHVLFEKLKDYYNGYSWDGENTVYNPFSILNFFGTYEFKNYWFASNPPTFLDHTLTNTQIEQYEHYRVSNNFLDTFEIGSHHTSERLFQEGYLTKKKVENEGCLHRNYILSYPNREVGESLLQQYTR
ncbi:MAG: AAA family ATPase [Candidatus Omnitrophota bacterium]